MKNNEIKAVIFDFNDTLYYGVDWREWRKLIQDYFFSVFKEQSSAIKSKYNIVDDIRYDALCKVLESEFGHSAVETWINYKKNIPLSQSEINARVVSKKEIQKFKDIGCLLFIVTNSTIDEVERFAKVHEKDMDLSLFTEIVINEFEGNDKTKRKSFKYILGKYKFQPETVIAVGDLFDKDILPAKEMNMKAFQCKDGFTFEEVMNGI